MDGLTTNLSRRKRLRWVLYITFLLFAVLLIRIAFIQFVQGEELQAMAYQQQSLDRNITPKRGGIYDATGKVELAISASVETVTVNPVNIPEEQKEKVAKKLAEIFELDYEATLKKVKKRSSIETIAKRVDKAKTDTLRVWMEENNIKTGINIDEDTKRYYPFNNLASQIIGFCGSDNQGLEGLESYYEENLKGESGKIVRVSDARGGEIEDEAEQYIPAVDGDSLVLTIDATIQGIVEKYLKLGCIDNACTDGGSVIIMNPNNGDIMAMANYPDYNLNDPYSSNTEELAENWETMSSTDKTKAMQQAWRNKSISDTYEPGSVFKIITASAALEEGITTTDKEGEFNCTGGIEIAGVRIKCWRYYRPHGSQSLREALMNSCNPVFIGLGQKMGVSTYYSYLNKFGFLDKTHIDLLGEAKGIFLAEKKVGPVELATISFGQRFEITPIQMVTAISAIANGGEYVKPRVVKAIIDGKTGEKQEIAIEKKGRVVSKETAEGILSMLESVVAEGTGKNGGVQGYAIGGKTGTSEDGVDTNRYIASFLAVAPVTDPQLVMLVVLYNPTGEGGHGGGGVAAPIASQILSEVLPYLKVNQDYQDQVEVVETIEVPELRELTLKEAEKQAKEIGLELDYTLTEGEERSKEEITIKEQTPKPGIKVNKGSKIQIEI